MTTLAAKGNPDAPRDGIFEGYRNQTLTSLAGAMRRKGSSPEAIEVALLTENQRCVPPLPEAEVRSIAASIGRYAPGPGSVTLLENADPERDKEAEYHLTDLGNAQLFVKLHGEDVRYCPEMGWLVWEGRRWRRDDDGAIARLALDVPRQLWAEARLGRDVQQRSERARHAARSESSGRVTALLDLARILPGVPIRAAALDAEPDLLGTKDGFVLDLARGEARPAERRDYITKMVGVSYIPDADCPTWRRFVMEVFGDNEDLVDGFQRALGYAMTGHTDEQVFFLLFGIGANGKSTALEALRYVLGDYAAHCPTSTFMLRTSGGDQNNDIARLRGARLVTANESGEDRRLHEELVKQLTGGDMVTARFLYREHFEFRPQFKLFLAVNHLPKIGGNDHAMWRRIRLFPFEVTFSPEKQDHRLRERLQAEGPGILNWLLDGAAQWYRGGLGLPTAVVEATEAYRRGEDAIGRFVEECCRFDPAAETSAKDLNRALRCWCEENDQRPVGAKALARHLLARGAKPRHTNKARMWAGIALASGGLGFDDT